MFTTVLVHPDRSRIVIPNRKIVGEILHNFGVIRQINVVVTVAHPSDVTRGVPTDATTTLRLPAAEVGRTVVGLFNEERIAVRSWPAANNRIAIAELTW